MHTAILQKCTVRVPIEELVAVVSGDAPGLLRGRDTQLAVEGQIVWHVNLRDIPEKPELKLIAVQRQMSAGTGGGGGAGRGGGGGQKDSELLEMIGNVQSNRLNEQRAAVPFLPGLHATRGKEQLFFLHFYPRECPCSKV